MLDATAVRETSRRLLSHYLPTPANRREIREDESARLSGPTFLRPPSPARTVHLLVIGDDPTVIPQQLRVAFPAPAHRVQVADTGPDWLEHVRTDVPDVIVLAADLPDPSSL